jgi:hypothetical protein
MPADTATAAFVRAIRKFAVQTQAWEPANRYYTKPDERLDMTLIAFRVYGDRSLYIVPFAAAGLDTFEQSIPEQWLVMPTAAQLAVIKRDTGYLTDDEKAAFGSLD